MERICQKLNIGTKTSESKAVKKVEKAKKEEVVLKQASKRVSSLGEFFVA